MTSEPDCFMSFGNNYRNPVITGILRHVRWNLPTLHPKWEVEPGDPIRTGKCSSILSNTIFHKLVCISSMSGQECPDYPCDRLDFLVQPECTVILGKWYKLAENAVDNDMSFW